MRNQQLLIDGVDGVSREHVEQILGCVRDELEDHRLAINDNTSEIQGSFEIVNQLSLKIDKLQERIDELTLIIKGQNKPKKFSVTPLNSREKEIFKALYELNERFAFVTYDQIARKAGLTKEMSSASISSMLTKGIPLIKRFVGRTCLLKIDSDFKEKQTKGNVVGLDVPLTHWFG